jgi:thymidylate synthase (FAD)
MKRVEPKVFLFASTQLNPQGVQAYLNHIQQPGWQTDTDIDGQKLIEMYGRGCYASWGVGGHNLNLSRVRTGNSDYIRNIIAQRHGSVLEHVNVSFMISDVSRVFTHELVRHRVGTAISQQSMRYVRTNNLGLWLPPQADSNSEVVSIFEETYAFLERQHQRLSDLLGLDDPAKNFPLKKFWTSLIRRMLPEGRATDIGWTANLRTLRTVIELRTDPAAEVEIRYVFAEIARIVSELYPDVFADFTVEQVDGLPCYKPAYSKV